MDLEELRAFLVIVETGSFLAAATELGVSRGMLRRRVDALEARIGAPLLERSPKGVVITDAGALLAKQGRRLIQSSSALLSAVREVAREPVGELRVSLPIGLPPHMLVTALELLHAALPRVRVDTRLSAAPITELLDEVDVAVRFGDENPGSGWIAHELLRVPVRLLAHVRYLERRGHPVDPAELAEHTLLAWSGPDIDPTRWPLHEGATLAVEPAMVSNDAHLVRQAVIRGLGIGLVPDAPIPEPRVAPNTLVPVLEQIGTEVALRLIVPSVLAGSPKIAQIVAVARKFSEFGIG
jgi:DNA-binding transcriptional LysR family regulator